MKKSPLFFLWICLCYVGYAQPVQLTPFNNYFSCEQWDTSEGLPQNSVTGLVQADDGYIWLATFDGLLRFNGINFKLYNSTNVKGMTNGNFLGMKKDIRGMIVAMTLRELVIIDSNKVAAVYPLPVPVKEIGGIINVGPSDFIVYNEKCIYRFRNRKFSLMMESKDKAIMNVAMDRSGNLYVSIYEMLSVIRPNGKVVPLGIKMKHFVQTNVLTEEVVVINGNEQIHLRDGRVTKIDQPQQIPGQQVLQEIVFGKDKILFDTDKGFVLKTPEGYFDFSTDEQYRSCRVYDIIEDFNGDIWLGTVKKGLLKLNRHTITFYDWQYGIKGYSVFMVYGSSSGKIYADDACNGVYELDPHSQQFQPTPYKGCVWTMAEDQQGNIWYSSFSSGIQVYQKEKHLKVIGTPEMRSNVILSLYLDQNKVMWAGTNSGIYIFPEADYSRPPVLVIPDTMEVYRFYEHANKMYVATNNGLYVFKDRQLQQHFSEKNGLPTNELRCTYEEENGTLWLGTAKAGLLRIKNGKVFQFPYGEIDGLNMNVWTLVYDNGNFWMSSNNGIYCAGLKDLNYFAEGKINSYNVDFYGKMDGVKNIEFNSRTQNAYARTSDGSLWFCGVEGIAKVQPSHMAAVEKLNYKITFEAVNVDDTSYAYQSTVTVPYKNEMVSVAFNYPCFKNQHQLKFEYYLEGLTQHWFPVNGHQVVTLGNLHPGEYKLHIRLVGTDNEAVMTILVPMPFWMDIWFKIVVGLLLVALSILLTAMILRRVNREKIRNLRMRGRLAQLEVNVLKAQMNPHFVFNCLSSIQYLFMKGDMDKANIYMVHFSHMLRELIDFTRSDGVSIRKKVQFLDNYIALENLQFDRPFEYAITVQGDIDQDAIILPSLFIQPFVENAIKHGLKNLRDRKGRLDVAFTQINNVVTCTITDNGIGRTEAAKRSKRQAYKAHSTEINEERVKMMALVNQLYIHVHYTDLTDENGLALGTQVKIDFEFNKKENAK